MKTVNSDKQVADKAPYERPTLEKRERLEDVTEQPDHTLSSVSIKM
jgi:hypothetical protein